MSVIPGKTNQSEEQIEEMRTQIARLPNERLMQMKQDAESLSSDLGWGACQSSFTEAQRQETEALRTQVKAVIAAITAEYNVRILHGYRSRVRKLLQALQPSSQPVQETGERRVIPINAEAAAQQEQEQQPGLQHISDLVGQLHTALNDLMVGNGVTSVATEATMEKEK